jgi:hypothetical protein
MRPSGRLTDEGAFKVQPEGLSPWRGFGADPASQSFAGAKQLGLRHGKSGCDKPCDAILPEGLGKGVELVALGLHQVDAKGSVKVEIYDA